MTVGCAYELDLSTGYPVQYNTDDCKWLVNTEFLDFEHRKLLGFEKPSHQPEWLLTNQE